MMKSKGETPVWYIIIFSAAYLLPLLVSSVLSVFATGMDALAAFLGTFVIGLLVYAPFYAIYYAVLTAIHAVVDEILIRSRSKAMCCVNLLVSFVLSVLLTAHTISIINSLDKGGYDISALTLAIFAVLWGTLFVWDIARCYFVRRPRCS